MKNKAVILDRDGTINVEKNYLYKIEEFEFTDGAEEAIKLLNDNGYKVIVITNQAGVARGYYSENDINKLHQWINNKLNKIGAYIDAFYYCPHHPQNGLGKYRINCDCRKPNNGLYLQAIKDFDIDVQNSFTIGDKITDLIPGKNLSMKTVLVHTGYGLKERYTSNLYDYEVKNLKEFTQNIINK